MASDFIFIRKSRNAVSTFLHVILNILLGVGSIAVTIVSGSWIVGFILVLLSKWRIFAVRPRYYFLNIKSNLVDLIVGFSFVLMAYFLGVEVIPAHYILMALYSLWLTVVKPKTTEAWNLVQAEVAIFMGTAVASILSAALLGHSLKLPQSPQLQMFYLVPFNNKKKIKDENGREKEVKVKEAVFQLSYRGYLQLAMRSGQYRRIHACDIREGELKSYNPITEEYVFEAITDYEKRKNLPVVGYYA